MKTVQAYPDIRVVGALNDAPRTAVVVDEAAPCQRLECHLDVVLLRELAEPAQLVGGDLVGVDGGGGNVAAHQDDADAQPLCGRERGACAAQVVSEGLLVDALDVAQRLVQLQRQSKSAGEGSDLLGAV